MIRVLLVSILLAFSQVSFAEDLTDEKKRVIDELLEITGALKIGEMMGTAVADQIIVAMSQRSNLDPKAIAIVQEEVKALMIEQFIDNGFVHNMSYGIYHKYFSTKELKEIVAFYKTPTGKRMALHLPQITQESMMAGQKHGQSLGPEIEKRILERFKKEGIELK
ncbi:DUF2059 domain-containing protein [Pleionea sp. CnH1-48]|uniref:DUF2059 domain-containing protein n=1 Tax=Pleionea sp. CnH1-48 TaxID=2954494 RepID=UPI00209778B1|nr:DUF2059 domain-containing protein [Pleionea sp. CnH1-48]MCO7222711.1 DUF2059 domain-containing protein [Pleionea sp. CnH1-48]